MGKCTLVLIFYNCLFGLLVLFFRIRRIQMIHQFIQIYLQMVYSLLKLYCAPSLGSFGFRLCFFSHSSGMPSPSESVGAGSDLYSGSLLRLSVGQPFRWCFHETLHRCNSLCGFLLRFVGLRHRGGERLRQIEVTSL